MRFSKPVVAIGILAAVGAFFALHGGGLPPDPFTGSVVTIGQKGGRTVTSVTFQQNETSEALGQNHMSIVTVPDRNDVPDGTPLGNAITSGRYIGYRYSTPDAAAESAAKVRADGGEPLTYAELFPGQFFASDEARAADAFVAGFESQKNISFLAPSQVALSRGAKYIVLALDGNIRFRIAPDAQQPVCGDGSIEGAEVCDDGNTATGDGCSDFCSVENGFTCTGEPSSCTVVQDPGLIIVAQDLPATGTGASFENKLIARFTATATGGTSLIHINTVRLRAVQGLGVAMGPFVVGRDGDNNGVIDESELGSDLTPIRAGDTDVIIPFSQSVAVGTTVLFEVYGRFFSDPIDPVKFEFASEDLPEQSLITAQTYITAQTAESEALGGIDTDGSNPSADIHVTTYTGTLWTLVNICGNGLTEQHQCDDGNQVSGDGCSSVCAIESGYVCSGEPSVCTVLVCGDGLIQGPEECDDGNTADTDGCSQSCTIEAGFFCSGQPSTCAPSGG